MAWQGMSCTRNIQILKGKYQERHLKVFRSSLPKPLSAFLALGMTFCLSPMTSVLAAKQQERLGTSSSQTRITPKSSSQNSDQSTSNSDSADPAYDAFRKGEYLKALKLAKALAKKGEMQAFTLAGRIYAGGLGVNSPSPCNWQKGSG